VKAGNIFIVYAECKNEYCTRIYRCEDGNVDLVYELEAERPESYKKQGAYNMQFKYIQLL
jgi:hypothetical protein